MHTRAHEPGVAEATDGAVRGVVKAYVGLTKPRIIIGKEALCGEPFQCQGCLLLGTESDG